LQGIKDAVLSAMRNHGLGITDVTRALGISATPVSNRILSESVLTKSDNDFIEQGFMAAKLCRCKWMQKSQMLSCSSVY
jgi:hypothetical protein